MLRQTAALDRARLGLAQSEKLAALGQLAASISHEVRNPLAILRTTVQNLEEDPGSPDEVRRSCAFLRDEIDRLGRVTARSSGSRARWRLDPDRCGPASCSSAFGCSQPLEVREKGLRFEVRDAPDAPRSRPTPTSSVRRCSA